MEYIQILKVHITRTKFKIEPMIYGDTDILTLKFNIEVIYYNLRTLGDMKDWLTS